MAYPSGNIGTTYDNVLSAIAQYYGTGSDIWLKVAGHSGLSPQDLANIQKVPGVTVTVNSKGEFIGWDYENPFTSSYNPVSNVDSNVPNASYGTGGNSSTSFSGKVNGTAETSGGTTSMGSGARKVGTATKVATTVGNVASVVCAAGLGAKLGRFISEKAYESGYSWGWSEEDWENWVDGKDPLDQAVFRTLFGIDGDNTTAYLPEELLALEYLELKKKGVFDAPGIGYDTTNVQKTEQTLYYPQLNYPDVIPCCHTGKFVGILPSGKTETMEEREGVVAFTLQRPDGKYMTEVCSKGGSTYHIEVFQNGSHWTWTRQVWYNFKAGGGVYSSDSRGDFATAFPPSVVQYPSSDAYSDVKRDVLYLLTQGTLVETPPVEGVDVDPRASNQVDPTLITGNTPQEVLQQLKTNYPDLFEGSVYEDVPQADGSNKRITYIPVPFPTKDEQGNPITGVPSQDNPEVDPDTATDTLLDTITDIITDLLNPTPPATGDGDSPTTVTPVGSASSLWKIYNPTQAQLDSFGSWLWDSSFVEQIKKLFNDPMQAIIGVHKVFASPSIGGTATIKVGYLDSEVSSNWVDNQYTTINCGTVNVREYFGNVFDYSPYTKISLYLPFIGVVDLDTADVMRGAVSVKYHVDVLTGACLADVIIERDACGGVIYQYSGSAIVTYPVSSGNYMGMVAGVLSVASGIAGTVLSGGALAPALVGGAVGASHLHTDVSKSGGFSGCAGAMGCKKPYLIISRPQTAMADSYPHFTGKPANAHVVLSNCSGMTRVKSVYVQAIQRATDEEKDMIEAQLKAGVLV